MSADSFTAQVYKFNPAVDAKPVYLQFSMPRGPRITVLELLKDIYRHYDPDLSFRWSCGLGKCGACAVRVNGRPVLACQALADNEDLTIEPLENLPVIKDLIVERTPYEEKLKSIRPFLDRSDVQIDQTNKPSDGTRFKHVSTCLECLACLSACPTFGTVAYDFAGPAIFTVLSKWDAHPFDCADRAALAMRSGLHNCTTCKSCSDVCPKNIDVFKEAIQRLRAANVMKGRGLPSIQGQFGEALSRSGKLFSPRGQPFTQRLPIPINRSEAKEGVGVFLGCRLDTRMQGYAQLLVSLLEGLGYRVMIPRDQECCGGPLLWTGQTDWLEKQMQANVRAFAAAGVDTVVTACPGCGMVLKQDYPELYARLEGKEFPFKTLQVVELVKDTLLGQDLQPIELTVTYHDPCHLNRGQHIWDAPRQILRAIPGIRFIEMENADQCCGGLSVSANRHLSEKMAAKKAKNILATGAETVVTSCPTCQDTLYKALVKYGHKLPVYLVEEIISWSLNIKPGGEGPPMDA